MTSHTPAKITAVSSPGKVLLTGGYLVLDRKYNGLVFALDARIHVLVRDIDSESEDGTEGEDAGDDATRIEVRSPQFQGAVWRYRVRRLNNERGVEVEEIREEGERRGR